MAPNWPALAQRHAAQAGRPRLLLTWSERWRATALAVPAVRPLADAELNASLAALRTVTRDLDEARSQGKQSTSLQREQQRLEKAVRASSLRSPGAASSGQAPFSPADLLDRLGSAQLIEIVDIDGGLYVLTCGAAGSGSSRRAASATPSGPRTSPASPCAAWPAAVRATTWAAPSPSWPPRDPDSRTPFSARPSATWVTARSSSSRPGRCTPSRGRCFPRWATAWSASPRRQAPGCVRSAPPPRHRHVTLARGPGLATDGAEVPVVARLYDDVTVLADSEATAEKVLHALDGAWLAHIAAHGSFRADSPLFSSLRMHDGPLTVYDFEQLHRAPYRLVLSSCDSGVLAPAGADELLGLVSSLLPLGTAGIIAAIVPLNDDAVVPVMVDLHRFIRSGHTMAESICTGPGAT